MPHILSLPIEVRALIIELVLLEEHTAPINVASAIKSRIRPSFDKRFNLTTSISVQTIYERATTNANATALLLTCRTLNFETNTVIRYLFPHGVTYKLDVILVKHSEAWPTWLYVPVVARSVEAVEITFRNFEVVDEELVSADRFAPCHFPTLCTTRCLDIILDQFLYRGAQVPPCSCKRTWKHDSRSSIHNNTVPRFTVSNINISFCSGDDLDFAGTTNCSRICDTDRLAAAVVEHLERLLSIRPGIPLDGMLWYAGIGNIEISNLTTRIHEIDIGKRLGSLRKDAASVFGNDGCAFLKEFVFLLTFWEQKYSAVRKRIFAGLPVPESTVWPTLHEWQAWRQAASGLRDISLKTGERSEARWRRPMDTCLGIHDLLDALIEQETLGREALCI
jgi:hypothetical protein